MPPNHKSKLNNVPHFRTQITNSRAANYGIERITTELGDFPIMCHLHCDPKDAPNNIRLNFTMTSGEKELHEYKMSDDYALGFERYGGPGSGGGGNPFNFGHEREGHAEDNEISAYGWGTKGAGVAGADVMTVYTKHKNGKMFKIILDFQKMATTEDPIASYNLTSEREITEEEYCSVHPFRYGSTIVLSNIRKEIIQSMRKEELQELLMKTIADTYSQTIAKTGINIIVNDDIVKPNIDYYKFEEVKTFNQVRCIIIKKCAGERRFIEFNPDNKIKTPYKILTQNDKGEFNFVQEGIRLKREQDDYMALENYYPKGLLEDNGYHKDTMILCRSTNTSFIDNDKRPQVNPRGLCNIYRCGRLMRDNYRYSGNNSADKGGASGVKCEMYYKSKKLNHDFGGNRNKGLDMNLTNDTMYAVNATLKTLINLGIYDASTETGKKKYLRVKKSGIKIPENLQKNYKTCSLSHSVLTILSSADSCNDKKALQNAIAEAARVEVEDDEVEAAKKQLQILTKASDKPNKPTSSNIRLGVNEVPDTNQISELKGPVLPISLKKTSEPFTPQKSAKEDSESGSEEESKSASEDSESGSEEEPKIETKRNAFNFIKNKAEENVALLDLAKMEVADRATPPLSSDEDDDVNNDQSAQILESIAIPTKKPFGPGIQTRQTKDNVVKILNIKIPKMMKGFQEPKRVKFHNEACGCLLNMIVEKENRGAKSCEYHYNLATKHGFEHMKNDYFAYIDNKLPEDEVVGGSILAKFISEWE